MLYGISVSSKRVLTQLSQCDLSVTKSYHLFIAVSTVVGAQPAAGAAGVARPARVAGSAAAAAAATAATAATAAAAALSSMCPSCVGPSGAPHASTDADERAAREGLSTGGLSTRGMARGCGRADAARTPGDARERDPTRGTADPPSLSSKVSPEAGPHPWCCCRPCCRQTCRRWWRAPRARTAEAITFDSGRITLRK